MARSKRKTWLPESRCPVVPFGGHIAVELLQEKSPSLIQAPERSMADLAKMQRGSYTKMRIIAVAPDDYQDERYVSNKMLRPGMIVYGKIPFDMSAESITYMERDEKTKDLKTYEYWLIPDGSVDGISRFDTQPAMEKTEPKA